MPSSHNLSVTMAAGGSGNKAVTKFPGAAIVQKEDSSSRMVLRPLCSGVEIKKKGKDYRFELSSASGVVGTGGRLLAAAMVGMLFLFLVGSLIRFPYFTPFANVEERILTYTSAGNFIKYGFGNSGWLQDFATSSDPADHPYAYDHMPPGPDIFTALLLRALAGSYRAVQLVFWLIFLVGIVCYVKIAGLILGRFNLRGSGYTLLFFDPLLLLRVMDDPLYAPFPLLAFLPLLTLGTYYRKRSRGYLYCTLGLALVASIYLNYLALAVVVCSWIFLYLTGLIRLEGRHLIAFLSVVAGGVLLHLLQNALYLGAGPFIRELGMTLTNRILGVPSKAEMKTFYRSVGLVHHGATPLVLSAFLSSVWRGFSFAGRGPLVMGGLACVGLALSRQARFDKERCVMTLPRGQATVDLGYLGGLAVWIIGSLVFPMVMFPAFTQEYGVRGVGLHAYFLAIGATTLLLYSVREGVRRWPGELPRTVGKWGETTVAIIAIVLVGLGAWRAGQRNAEGFREAVSVYQAFQYARISEIREDFGGQVFMTNINPVTVGFFAQEAGYGACEPASLPDSGGVDPSECQVAYMRRDDHYRQMHPRYFFFFRALFPGFSECQPTGLSFLPNRGGDDCVELMRRNLSDRFERLYANDLFEVFDLHARRIR